MKNTKAEECLNRKGLKDLKFTVWENKTLKDITISQIMTDFAASEIERLMPCEDEIEAMKDNTGMEGCTYEDTDFDSQSVVYGYNMAVDYVKEWIINHIKSKIKDK